MATDVTYNGVFLHNVTTRQWDQEIVLDPSGTDLIAHRFTLRFECIIHTQASIGGGPPAVHPVGYSPASFPNTASLYQQIYNRLTHPRGVLIVVQNGVEVLRAEPTTSLNLIQNYRDTDNGPKPLHVNLTHIANDRVYRVEFAVQCDLVKCNPATTGSVANLVVSNRWSLQEEMDANFFTTRTIRGRLRLSASEIVPAHLKRHLVVPGLEDGFRRERIEFAVAENGLDCDYQVVDVQAHTACPYPGAHFEGRHTESAADGGLAFFSDIHLRMEGAPTSDKRLMIARLMQIAHARLLGWRDPNNPAGWFLLNCAVTDHVGKANVVELSLRIQNFGPDTSTAEHAWIGGVVTKTIGTRLTQDDMGAPLPGETISGRYPYDARLHPRPHVFGYTPHEGERRVSVLAMLHCYLQQPCAPDAQHSIATYEHRDQKKQAKSESRETGDNEDPDSNYFGPIPTGSGGLFSDATRAAQYTMCKVESRYVFRDLVVALPVAQSDAAAAPGDPAAVVAALGRRQCYRIVETDNERVGALPVTPIPAEIYASGTLTARRISSEVTILPPKLTGDGRQKIHRALSTAVYALNRPPAPDEVLAVGTLPYTALTAVQSGVTLNQLASGYPV